eukprot:357881-Chlamydomonas_euryale.AAC.25
MSEARARPGVRGGTGLKRVGPPSLPPRSPGKGSPPPAALSSRPATGNADALRRYGSVPLRRGSSGSGGGGCTAAAAAALYGLPQPPQQRRLPSLPVAKHLTPTRRECMHAQCVYHSQPLALGETNLPPCQSFVSAPASMPTALASRLLLVCLAVRLQMGWYDLQLGCRWVGCRWVRLPASLGAGVHSGCSCCLYASLHADRLWVLTLSALGSGCTEHWTPGNVDLRMRRTQPVDVKPVHWVPLRRMYCPPDTRTIAPLYGLQLRCMDYCSGA